MLHHGMLGHLEIHVNQSGHLRQDLRVRDAQVAAAGRVRPLAHERRGQLSQGSGLASCIEHQRLAVRGQSDLCDVSGLDRRGDVREESRVWKRKSFGLGVGEDILSWAAQGARQLKTCILCNKAAWDASRRLACAEAWRMGPSDGGKMDSSADAAMRATRAPMRAMVRDLSEWLG